MKLLDLLEARGILTLGQAYRISSRLVAERRQLASSDRRRRSAVRTTRE